MTTRVQRNVMRKIYFVYVIRKCCQKVTFELVGFIVVTGTILTLISAKNIIKNMPSIFEPFHMARFGYVSLLNTEHYVQLLIASSLIAGTIVAKKSFGHFVKFDRIKIKSSKKRERVLA